MKRTLIAIAMLAASVGFSAAQAQGYVGASVGQSELKEDCTGGVTCDYKDTGFKVFGGYMLMPNFGIEAAYVDLGKATETAPGISAQIESSGFGLWAKGVLPIDSFALFAKAGFAYLDTEVSGSISGLGSASVSESNTNFAWGVGGAYHFTKNLGLRVEYERFRVEFRGEKSDVDLLSAGIVYRF